MVRVFRKTSLVEDDEAVELAVLDEAVELELEPEKEDKADALDDEEDVDGELEEDATDDAVLVLGRAEDVVVAADELEVLFEESKT
jgi:hypothetical protein